MNAFFWANAPCASDGRTIWSQYPAFLMFAIDMLAQLGGGSLAIPLDQAVASPSDVRLEIPPSVTVIPMPYYRGEAEVIRRFGPLLRAVQRQRSLIARSGIVIAVAPGVVGNAILELAVASGRPSVAVVRGHKRRSLGAIHPSGIPGIAYQLAARSMDLELELLRRRGVHVVGFGDALAREYGGVQGIPTHPLVADAFYRTAPQISASGTEVLFVGRLSPEKGPWVLLDALRIAKQRGRVLRARFVGEGPDAQPLRARARADGTDVTFAGHVPWGARLIDEMRAARLLVMPSLTEGTPTALAEAMAVGLPVVASAVGGIPGMSGEPPAVRLVPAGDSDALARAMTSCLDDPELSSRMIALGKARAAGYSISSEADRLAKILSQWTAAAHEVARHPRP